MSKELKQYWPATPTLYGEDAKRLIRDMNTPSTPEKIKFLKECRETYRELSGLSYAERVVENEQLKVEIKELKERLDSATKLFGKWEKG